MTKQNQKIGLLAATSLVVGNIIGAGIFVLPASLGKFGSISILGWILTASGALILAKILGRFNNEIKVKIKMLIGIKKLYPWKYKIIVKWWFTKRGCADLWCSKRTD